jgi:hypothetical protein
VNEGELKLLACDHAPVVVFHPEEKYPPLDPEAFIGGAELRWRGPAAAERLLAGGALGPIDPAQLGSGSALGAPGRERFRPVDLTRPYDARKARIGAFPGYHASALDSGFYLHYMRDRDDLVVKGGVRQQDLSAAKCFFEVDDDETPSRITYWYFLGGSTVLDSPLVRAHTDEIAAEVDQPTAELHAELLGRFIDLHEGDWEGFTVQLGNPPRVLLHQHGELVPASTAELNPVYVGRGSHAAVDPADKRGEATGDGARWLLDETNLCDARTQPWYGFGGAWGAVDRDIPNLPDALIDRIIRRQNRDPRSERTGPLGPSPFKAAFELRSAP